LRLGPCCDHEIPPSQMGDRVLRVQRWRREEIVQLRVLVAVNAPADALAHKLGRSSGAEMAKMTELGLVRPERAREDLIRCNGGCGKSYPPSAFPKHSRRGRGCVAAAATRRYATMTGREGELAHREGLQLLQAWNVRPAVKEL